MKTIDNNKDAERFVEYVKLHGGEVVEVVPYLTHYQFLIVPPADAKMPHLWGKEKLDEFLRM